MTKHIAVLMGGLSPEREPSLMSGESVCHALTKLGYKFTVIDPTGDFFKQITEVKPDVVFNALHGTYGEDGIIPGILEFAGIPYTHSGVMSSALCLNKTMTKAVLKANGIRVPEGFEIEISELYTLLKAGKHPMSGSYVIKPVKQGSSVGVFIVKDGNFPEFEQLNPDIWQYGDEVIIEKFIPGKELSTCVIGGKALGTLELRPLQGFYDYEAKYKDGKTDHIYPAEVPEHIYAQSLEYAELAHKVLGCRTMSRADMRYDPQEDLLCVLEINTHPGFTHLSIVPDIASKNGISFEDIVEQLLKEAKCETN